MIILFISVGVDFGFGSSSTAIVLTEFLKEEHKIIGSLTVGVFYKRCAVQRLRA